MTSAIALLALCATVVLSSPTGFIPDDPTPTEIYAYHTLLDSKGDVHVYWKYNTSHITFEVHARTLGYVGFGLSSNGRMFPADIVIGWVNNGQVFFTDRHSVGHSQPVIDESQDWKLEHGEENIFGTLLKMTRKLDTCDENDFLITEDTVRLLYAYHPDDPTDENSVSFHGMDSMGVKSVNLLSKIKSPPLPSDAQTRDWLNDNYLVPNKETTYRCKVFSLRDLGKKHHMVKFEPVIQRGHENIVHHILVYKCMDVDPKFIGSDYECYLQPNPSIFPCGNVFLGWEYGGGEFYFPENVGMPIGEQEDTGVYIMETHYNNPDMIPDFVDNSGIRITYTPTMRLQEAGLLMTGVTVDPLHIIPPHEDNFQTTGFCHSDCLNKGLQGFPNGVTVFAVWQHAHLLARTVKTRHYRNGVELEPLADEHHFDFNYQDYRYISKNTTLQAGDELVVECVYNSLHENKAALGGPSTKDEMCLSFIYYYPRMAIDYCRSIPLFDGSSMSKDFANELPTYDWSSAENKDKFKRSLHNSNYNATCHGENLHPKIEYVTRTIPQPSQTYTPKPRQCRKT